MKHYTVSEGYLQQWYFNEILAPNHIRVFTQFEVSCDRGHPRQSKLIRAVQFTGPGQYKKYPVNKTLIFICSVCGWENLERVRVDLV